MSQARAKALELAISAVGYGCPVTGEQDILRIAEVFLSWIDPPADLTAADGDDYPRMQAVSWGGPSVPDRY